MTMLALLALLLAVLNNPTVQSASACDGVQTAYTVGFPYQAQADLKVTSTTAGGVVTNLTLTTDFTLNLTSTQSTATLTLLAGSRCPSGSTLKILSSVALTQPTNLRTQGSYLPATYEQMFDRLTRQVQQVNGAITNQLAVTLNSNNTWTAPQVFTGSASDGPVTCTPQSADPSSPVNGEVWVNSTQQAAKVRVNGATNIFSGNPMLGANTGAGQSIPNNAQTIVVFGVVERDTDSGYNSGTGRYTVPAGKGGDYVIIASIAWNTGFATPGSLYIFKNAALTKAVQSVANPVAGGSTSIIGILNMVAGDIIDIRAFQASGGAISLSTNPVLVYFALKRISD